MTRLQNLLKGKTVQLSRDEIEDVVEKFPGMSEANYKRLAKAHRLGKGSRLSLTEPELSGSGFKSMAKRGVKSALKNKEISKLKDQVINKGLNIVADEMGLEGDARSVVKGLAKKGIDSGLDEFTGGKLNKKLGRKILKTGVKALKTGNVISNAMGYEDLDDMAIDWATKQTLGRIDPTGGVLTELAENKLNKLADKEMNKMSGGSVNPYLPAQLRGGAVKVYKDQSNLVHPKHPAYKPSALLDPQFDRLKLLQQQRNY